jgi:predicted Zn finger-like uncharacterized protein
MDIACPTCATAYEIDDGTVGEAGRKVRCAACGTVWRAFRDRPPELIVRPAPAAEPAPVIAEAPPMAPDEADIATTADFPAAAGDLEPAEPGHPAADDPSAGAAPEPRRKAKLVKDRQARKAGASSVFGRLLGWPTLAVAGTLGLLGAGYVFREPLVRIAPQSAAVFTAVGLPVNLRGIDIRDVKSRMVEDNGVSVLVIDGNLVNISKARVPVPRLRFAVLGDKGQEIYVWSAQADRGTLQPGESMAFRRRLAAPPTDGRDVSVRFLGVSDITAGLR